MDDKKKRIVASQTRKTEIYVKILYRRTNRFGDKQIFDETIAA